MVWRAVFFNKELNSPFRIDFFIRHGKPISTLKEVRLITPIKGALISSRHFISNVD